MNWIKISTGIMRDPSIISVAGVLGVSTPSAVGHVLGVLTALPQGSMSGDISHIPDAALEVWAMWTGKRGKFAEAFRAHLCDAQGVVRSWGKYNGSKLRELEHDRERKKAAREAARIQRMSGGHPADETKTSGRVQPLRDETRRDETRETTNNQRVPKRTRSGPKASSAKFPRFSKDLCDLGYTTWLERLGATDYAQFRKAFGPIFEIPEADRPAQMPSDEEFPAIIRLYAAGIRGTKAAQFVRPATCASVATHLAAAAREPDAERRLAMARHALGTTEEARRMERAAA